MVALAGGVPLTEFRRLADAVHTVLLRLDRIDASPGRSKARLPQE